MVRQLGGRFDELTRASFPVELIHRILSSVNEAGARVMHSMRQALPGWLVVVIKRNQDGWLTYPSVTHRISEDQYRRDFNASRIIARGDRVISRGKIYGPG